jgi:hypothetical protein
VLEGGDLYEALPCPYGCRYDDAGEAWCNECEPGDKRCNQTNGVEVCQDDAETWSPVENCNLGNAVCQAGACQTRICQPISKSCADGDVVSCSEDGLSYSVLEDCDDLDDACNPKTLKCQERDCEPGTKFCEEDLARSCDEYGFYAGAGSDCGNATCSLGECVDCATVKPSSVLRLDSVEQGLLTIYNPGACPLDIAGLELRITYVDGTKKQATTVLPSKVLNRYDIALLVSSNPEPGFLTVNGVDAIADFDATVALCDGPCTTDSVFDLVQVGSAPPALQAPLTFTGVLAPKLQNDERLARYTFLGKNPTFLASDWTLVKP